MASGDGNNKRSMIAILIFFVMFFLPAWVMGDRFSWKEHIIWGIFLVVLITLMNYIDQSLNPSDTAGAYQMQSVYDPQPQLNEERAAEIHEDTSAEALKIGKEQLNKSLIDGYQGKLEFKDKTEREIGLLQERLRRTREEISHIQSEQQRITDLADKPFYLSRKKYLAQNQPEMEQLSRSLVQKRDDGENINVTIRKKQQEIAQIKYHLYDESNEAFEELKQALDAMKNSCYIAGAYDLKNSSISTFQRMEDLKYVKYAVQPYGILLEPYRFYIFPTGIWVFEGDGKLVGIYEPKAMTGTFEAHEIMRYPSDSLEGRRQNVYEDTKIITKVIPHTTWQHTWRDGSPDTRFGYNPSETYHISQDYYVECLFELGLCGCKLNYAVSSYDHCALLEKAIKAYGEIRGNKDIIPIVLNLLERCAEGNDIKEIKELVAAH